MRKYFFWGQELDADYLESMKEGGKAWTETDPRPNTELVLLLDSNDPEVSEYARSTMEKLWRNEKQLHEMAEQAMKEFEANKRHHMKEKFATFIKANAVELGGKMPQSVEQWRAWWQILCRGDWMIYEEYDRRTNVRPHPIFGLGMAPLVATGPSKREEASSTGATPTTSGACVRLPSTSWPRRPATN